MLIKKTLDYIAKGILAEAVNNADTKCTFWHHQPKIPDSIAMVKIECENGKKKIAD